MEGDRGTSGDSQFISFQDFSPINHPGSGGQAQLDLGASDHRNFGNINNDSVGVGIIEDLHGMPDKTEAPPARNFWTIEYYQKFFDVNTNDVVERIKWSMIPHGVDNYWKTHIRPKPDLYGPFWICVTLVFSIAISGNMANYLQTANSRNYHWRYEFHLVSYAATAIFLYAWILPLALWAVLKWTSSPPNMEEELIEDNKVPGLLELLCLYGYSLAIYIPVAFLWTVQIEWLRWSLVGIAALLSGGVLLRSLSPVIAGKHKLIYITVILGMHLLLAAGFMLYFFHVPSKNVTIPISAIVSTVQPTVSAALNSMNNKTIPNVQ
ncbi:protein YIPF1 [Cephus cinctus]|uniref:Protein YIPF n=1 Tax=Cephus cinctus TaxID=211228 RepID=A0AAJ7BS59_CEPCN|nr:protein YIPF1 [Cephus cinctus]